MYRISAHIPALCWFYKGKLKVFVLIAIGFLFLSQVESYNFSENLTYGSNCYGLNCLEQESQATESNEPGSSTAATNPTTIRRSSPQPLNNAGANYTLCYSDIDCEESYRCTNQTCSKIPDPDNTTYTIRSSDSKPMLINKTNIKTNNTKASNPFQLYLFLSGIFIILVLWLNRRKNPKQIMLEFNKGINNQDIAKLASLMHKNYVYIDSGGKAEKGIKKGKNSWKKFFKNFPDYKNNFNNIFEKNDLVIALGHSVCSNKLLEKSYIWTAKVKSKKLKEWRVYNDTPKNQEILDISNK